MPENTRDTNITRFVTEFQVMNLCSDENTRNFEHSVRLVIEEKLRLYPGVFIEVIDSSLVEIGGRDQINSCKYNKSAYIFQSQVAERFTSKSEAF